MIDLHLTHLLAAFPRSIINFDKPRLAMPFAANANGALKTIAYWLYDPIETLEVFGKDQ